MTETNEVAVSHAPRHSRFFPSPESVERQLQRQFRECELTAKPEPLSPTLQREQANARLINWGAYKRGESRTVAAITSSGGVSQIYKIMRDRVGIPPAPPPIEVDIKDAIVVEQYVNGLTKKNKEIAEYRYEEKYGVEMIATMSGITLKATDSRLKRIKEGLT